MTAPTPEHVERVALLDTLAQLAGCRSRTLLAPSLFPDLVRVDLVRRRLLVGDAKAVETSACYETHRRLRRYFRAVRRWLDNGFTVRVTLCHPLPSAEDWRRRLAGDAHAAGLSVLSSGSRVIGGSDALSWVDVGHASMMSHSSSTVRHRGGSYP
jgi:hypothetical protein